MKKFIDPNRPIMMSRWLLKDPKVSLKAKGFFAFLIANEGSEESIRSLVDPEEYKEIVNNLIENFYCFYDKDLNEYCFTEEKMREDYFLLRHSEI